MERCVSEKVRLKQRRLEIGIEALKTEIKICGLTSQTEAGWVIREKVDYAGIVMFFEKSKRNNTPESAFQILREFITAGTDQSGFRTKTVAVTVSPTYDQVKMIEKLGFDLLQVHGELKEDVRKNTSIRLIRAVNSKEEVDGLKELLEEQKDRIEGFLFDAKEPGSGQAFDWQMLQSYPWLRTCGKKLFLAGGLTKDNVKQAIEAVSPDVVDVSSGVEISKETVGKDREKIKQFVNTVRNE